MDILKEFLESSTIHGLTYISTSKSRAGKVFWALVVLGGFCSASYLINNSYVEWSTSPVAISIHTVPIEKLPFPKVTVCPPKGSNTALNPDLMVLKDKTIAGENREKLLRVATDHLIKGSHVFAKTAKVFMGQYTIRMFYEGLLSFDFQWKRKFAVENTAFEGTGWLRSNLNHVESKVWHQDMQNLYTIKFQDNFWASGQ